jgi:hypothetical protein
MGTKEGERNVVHVLNDIPLISLPSLIDILLCSDNRVDHQYDGTFYVCRQV